MMGKIYVEIQGGQVTPLLLPGGAHVGPLLSVSIQCYNLKLTLANILLNKLNLLCCSIVVKKLAQTIGVRY